MYRMFCLLVGFGFTISGGVSMIMYLNLLTTGYSYKEYTQFLMTRMECYLFIVGLLLIAIAIYFPSRNKKN